MRRTPFSTSRPTAPRSEGRSRTRSATRGTAARRREPRQQLGLRPAGGLERQLAAHRHLSLAKAGRIEVLLDDDDALAAQAGDARLRIASQPARQRGQPQRAVRERLHHGIVGARLRPREPNDRSARAHSGRRQHELVALAGRRQVVADHPLGEVQDRRRDERYLVQDLQDVLEGEVVRHALGRVGPADDDADHASTAEGHHDPRAPLGRRTRRQAVRERPLERLRDRDLDEIRHAHHSSPRRGAQVRGSIGRYPGTGPPQQPEDFFHVLPHVLLRGGIAEQVGRVIGRHHGDALVLTHAAAQARDGLGRLQQPVGAELAETDQHARTDRPDLLLEERLAGQDLGRLGIAVLRRTALDHVRDEHVLARHAQALLDDVRQQLSGPAHEREPLLVLFGPRRLAHEHQLGLRVALAEHDRLAARGERAAVAVADRLAHGGEQRRAIRRCRLRARRRRLALRRTRPPPSARATRQREASDADRVERLQEAPVRQQLRQQLVAFVLRAHVRRRGRAGARAQRPHLVEDPLGQLALAACAARPGACRRGAAGRRRSSPRRTRCPRP